MTIIKQTLRPHHCTLDPTSTTHSTAQENPPTLEKMSLSAAGKLRAPVAFISTGGTLASVGANEFDLRDYSATNRRVKGEEVVEKTGIKNIFANHRTDIKYHDFDPPIDSTAFTKKDWSKLAELCEQFERSECKGIVIGHGTATMEETAVVLSLVLRPRIPVVLTGSMRPLTGISSDAAANLAAAFRVATHEFAEGQNPGVVVVLDDKIHDPWTVSKTHTGALGAFQSPWGGPMGSVEGDDVKIRWKRQSRPSLWFGKELIPVLPRVDIVYSYIGADGTAVRAFIKAGAQGIVSAGFGPGLGSPAEIKAFGEAIRGSDKKKPFQVVQSSRLGAGTVVDSKEHRDLGIIAGNDLNPQKARILLAFCLAAKWNRQDIQMAFNAL